MPLFIGLMSGTSMDGIDGVVLDLNPAARFAVLAHAHSPFTSGLRQRLFDLNSTGPDEIHRAALASNDLARAYAQVVATLCSELGLSAADISGIGAHGQTIRHQPGLHDATGYTCQLLNGALLAELTGMDVVCDFRSRDVAAGGQGAPLVPAFHRAAFGARGKDIAVLNLGGIANITFLYGNGHTAGHDCGPGNVLLDAWCQEHTGRAYDAAGTWASQGKVLPTLLATLLQEPYFAGLPPKSTGRDLFNSPWLSAKLQSLANSVEFRPVDVQATLSAFTANVVATDVSRHMAEASSLLICGGGALNTDLVARLSSRLPHAKVESIEAVSQMNSMQVEAAAFAWLAWAHTSRTPGNNLEVTGAAGQRILGAMYPA